jgi:hypothetical protein
MAFVLAAMKVCGSVAVLAWVRCDSGGSGRDVNWSHVLVRGKVSAGSWRV